MSWLTVIALMAWKWNAPNWWAQWTEKWGLLALLFGCALIFKIKFKSDIFKITLVYFLTDAVVNGYLSGYRMLNDPRQLLLLRPAAQEQIIALFAFLVFLLLEIDLKKPLFLASMFMTYIVLIAKHPWNVVAIMFNPSITATFITLASFVAPWAIVPIIITKSWTAFGAFLAGWIMRIKSLWIRALAVLISGGSAIYYVHIKGVPDNGRIGIWQGAWKYWLHLGPKIVLFGLGPGTTKVWNPMQKIEANPNGSQWLFWWMHCDWLQELTELGKVGAALLLICAIYLWKIAEKKERPLLAAFYIAMASNPTTHLVLPALVGWSLFKKLAVNSR